jgi:hypothetical protein
MPALGGQIVNHGAVAEEIRQDVVEISIVHGTSAWSDGARDAHVDITSKPFDLMELLGQFGSAAESQSIPLSAVSELQLGRLIDVDPIKFLQDGRWRLSLRTTHAELALLG